MQRLNTCLPNETDRQIKEIASWLGHAGRRFHGRVIEKAVAEMHQRMKTERAIYGEPEKQEVKGGEL